MVEPGGEADLGKEPLPAQHCGQLGLQHLERDVAIVLEVVGEEDGGHPAAPELPVDGVGAGESFLQPRAELRHACSLETGRRVPSQYYGEDGMWSRPGGSNCLTR